VGLHLTFELSVSQNFEIVESLIGVAEQLPGALAGEGNFRTKKLYRTESSNGDRPGKDLGKEHNE
jgi:hypothetical protein